MNSSNIDWDEIIKKEARGMDDEDFGEVQGVQDNYVLVQKGIINKENFYIPKDQAESYDGDVLKFRFSKEELSKYQNEQSSTISDEAVSSDTAEERETDEESIPKQKKDSSNKRRSKY
jgi:hypothetical protein